MLDAHAADRVPDGVPEPATGRAPARRLQHGSAALYLVMLGIVLMGFNRTRLAGWPVSDLAFLAAAGAVAVNLLAGRQGGIAPPRARRSSPPILLGAILLLTAGTMSAFESWQAGRSISVVVRFAWVLLGWFWVLRAVSPDRWALSRLLWAWRVMILLNSLIAIFGQMGVVNVSVQNIENRQTGFFDTPNDLAGLLVVGFPLLFLGVPRGPERPPTRELAARGAASAFVVYAVATTGSMTALIAAMTSGIAMFAATTLTSSPGAARWRRKPLLPMGAALVVCIGLGALATSDLPAVERFTRFQSGDQGVNQSVDSRDEANAKVIERFDETLVVGVGFGSYDPDDQSGQVAFGAHNMFMRVVYQAGLPGLVGLLAILFFAFRHVLRLIVHTRGTELHPVAVALLATFVAANTFAMFQPTEFHRYYWLPVGMIGVLWALCRQELHDRTVAIAGANR